MKSSFSCRRCGRWLEGEWSDASSAERIELQRQMDNGICDECPKPPQWTWFYTEPGRRDLERGTIARNHSTRGGTVMIKVVFVDYLTMFEGEQIPLATWQDAQVPRRDEYVSIGPDIWIVRVVAWAPDGVTARVFCSKWEFNF